MDGCSVYFLTNRISRVFQKKSEKYKAVTAWVLRFIMQSIHHMKEKHFKIFCSNFRLPCRSKTITTGSNSIYIVFGVNFDKIHPFFSLGQMKSSTNQIKIFTTQRILLCFHFCTIKNDLQNLLVYIAGKLIPLSKRPSPLQKRLKSCKNSTKMDL